MNQKHDNHEAACKAGGRNASQKVYYCATCDKVGTGNRMTHFHLYNDCDGKATRPLVKTDAANRHRLEEAQLNTEQFYADMRTKHQKEITRLIKQQMVEDIEKLRKAASQAMENILKNPYNGQKLY